MSQPDAPTRSSPLVRVLLGACAALVLALVLGAALLYRSAQAARAQSREDAVSAVARLLSPDLLEPDGGMVRLITRGSYADNYEVELAIAQAIRAQVGANARQVTGVTRAERYHSPQAQRPSGFEQTLDLVLEDGRSERWIFVYGYHDLALARIVSLESARRAE